MVNNGSGLITDDDEDDGDDTVVGSITLIYIAFGTHF
jgi:hypothetical protein